MDHLEKTLGYLVKASRCPPSRKENVDAFLQYFFRNQSALVPLIGRNAVDIVDELAYDLTYFVADPKLRAEDPSYYGDERLIREIQETFYRLSKVGVPTPDS
jgi:hypothetical protein